MRRYICLGFKTKKGGDSKTTPLKNIVLFYPEKELLLA